MQAGARAHQRLVLVQARLRDGPGGPRFGFTASKKVSKRAVTRNRARRRLKEAARLLGAHALPQVDYVLVAREATADAPWLRLVDDVRTALIRLRSELTGGGAPNRPPRGPRGRAPEHPDAKDPDA